MTLPLFTGVSRIYCEVKDLTFFLACAYASSFLLEAEVHKRLKYSLPPSYITRLKTDSSFHSLTMTYS